MAIDVDFDPFQIFQKHPDPAWIYDLETLRILAVNEAAKSRYGYEDDEFRAMTIADLRTSDEQSRLLYNLKTTTGEGQEQSGPWQHISKSGEFLYVEIVSNSVMFQGRHTRLVIARDASLRVNLEASLFQAQARLRMANWELDLESNVANWSPRLYELLGLDPTTYTNTREEFLALLHPDDRDRYVAAQSYAIATRSLFDEEFRIKDPLGQFQSFHEVGEIVGRGGKTYFSAVIQDVTNLVTSRAENQRVARQLQNVMEGMTDGFYLLDEEWRVSFINKHGACMLGKSPNDIEGRIIWDLFPEVVGTRFADVFVKSRKTGQSERLTEYYPPFDRWFEMVAHPGDKSLAIYFRDATEDIKATEYRRLLDAAIQKLDEAVLITQAPELGSQVSPQIIYANEATSHITGYARAAILGQTLELFFGPATDGPELAKLFAAIRDHRSERVELVSYTRDEEIYWVEINLTAVKDDHDHCTHFIAILSDITARKSAENDLRWAATRDELTGLLNRPMLKGILSDHLKDIKNEQATHALFFIDLDDFKNVNDTFGHSLGDMLLVEVANRLKTVVRINDFIARMSGDEFVVFVPYTSHEDAEIFAKQLLDVFFVPFDLTDARIAVSASIGLAIAPEDGITTEILIRNADIAMYVSKEDGRNTYTKYKPRLRQAVVDRTNLAQDLQISLRHDDDFRLVYQPQVTCDADKKVVGFEALLRWDRPGAQQVGPDQFIPIAESTGLIRALDQKVIEMAVTQIASWVDMHEALPVSVNISAISMQTKGFASHLLQRLNAKNIPKELFQVEIVESAYLDESSTTIFNIAKLSSAGICISIDDFGTGHSSLSYLKRLPVRFLKIDRSFVQRVALGSERDDALVQAILAMAKALKVDVVAEGVETEDQLAWLHQRGCALAQGYLVGRPVEADIVTQTLLKSKGRV